MSDGSSLTLLALPLPRVGMASNERCHALTHAHASLTPLAVRPPPFVIMPRRQPSLEEADDDDDEENGSEFVRASP